MNLEQFDGALAKINDPDIINQGWLDLRVVYSEYSKLYRVEVDNGSGDFVALSRWMSAPDIHNRLDQTMMDRGIEREQEPVSEWTEEATGYRDSDFDLLMENGEEEALMEMLQDIMFEGVYNHPTLGLIEPDHPDSPLRKLGMI